MVSFTAQLWSITKSIQSSYTAAVKVEHPAQNEASWAGERSDELLIMILYTFTSHHSSALKYINVPPLQEGEDRPKTQTAPGACNSDQADFLVHLETIYLRWPQVKSMGSFPHCATDLQEQCLHTHTLVKIANESRSHWWCTADGSEIISVASLAQDRISWRKTMSSNHLLT